MSDRASELTAAAAGRGHGGAVLAPGEAGDAQVFARLYAGHAPVVLSLCRRGLPQAEAEDALQESFLRALTKVQRLDAPESFGRWLYGIARRVCAERRRMARRRERREAHARPPEPAAQPSDRLAQAESLARLDRALDRLPDDERLAIHLYYLQENSPHAAAATLGLSRGGFYKLVARARQRLAVLMREAPVHERR